MTIENALKEINAFIETHRNLITEDLIESLRMAASALENNHHNCRHCEWYAEFEGVCTNGDSSLRGDIVEFPQVGCGCFEIVRPRTPGQKKEWIRTVTNDYFEKYTCPECGATFYVSSPPPHCPECNARLD